MASEQNAELLAKRIRLTTNGDNQSQQKETTLRSMIWLPTELWADILKLLSRRDLLRCVQTVCRRLHAIAELPQVPSVHIMRNTTGLVDDLVGNTHIMQRELAALAASGADLARHFRLEGCLSLALERYNFEVPNAYKRRCAAQQSLVGHSLELFRNCNLLLHDTPCQQFVCNHRDKQLRAFLALLRRPARPFSVTIRTMSDYWECTQFLMEPTILDCPRVKMANNISHRYFRMSSDCELFYNWLHHLPTREQTHQGQTRILITDLVLPDEFDEFMELFKKRLINAETPTDRRSFLFIFRFYPYQQSQPAPFRVENARTDEVLVLVTRDRQTFIDCHLRRCLAPDLDVAEQFYRDTFHFVDEQIDQFRQPVEMGVVPTLSLNS